MAAAPRIIFVNRYFAPDVSATSQILSDLAFHLCAGGREVHVVCADTLYVGGGRLPPEEALHGVHVHRVSGGRFGRRGLAGRAIDYAGLYVALRRRLAGILRADDIVIAKTDPPLLSVALAGLVRRRGARFLPWLQDLYPEVASALGVPLLRGPMEHALSRLRDHSLRHADGMVVIGSRMADRLRRRGLDPTRIHVIPNWSDDAQIKPIPPDQNVLRATWGLQGKFVVGYSGNLGRAHEFHTVLTAAERFRGDDRLAFLFIGGGHHLTSLRKEVRARRLGDLFHFQPYQDRDQLSQSLSAPDVHWLSLRPELEGLIVPSKFYGVAAAGRPVINVGAVDGEIAELVSTYKCGVTIAPGDGDGMAEAIARFRSHDEETRAMGHRSRYMLSVNYSRACAMGRWERILHNADVHRGLRPASLAPAGRARPRN